MDSDSPYMLLVAPIQEKIRREASVEDQELFGIDRLNVVSLSLFYADGDGLPGFR